MTCNLVWVGLSQWWCEIGPSGQAAWIQAIGSLIAISVAIAVPYWVERRKQIEKDVTNRKIGMAAAANLDVALTYQSAVLDFAPDGSNTKAPKGIDLEGARKYLRMRPRTQDALKDALDKSHYFSTDLCEKIVRLSVEAAAYERLIDSPELSPSTGDPDEFLRRINNTRKAILHRVEEVRELLEEYIPDRTS